jgi:hypothetical protein
MLDANGKECLLVVKSSNNTSMTIGHATGIMSFIHEYFKDNTHHWQISMELAIYPYGNKEGTFSTLVTSF